MNEDKNSKEQQEHSHQTISRLFATLLSDKEMEQKETIIPKKTQELRHRVLPSNVERMAQLSTT